MKLFLRRREIFLQKEGIMNKPLIRKEKQKWLLFLKNDPDGCLYASNAQASMKNYLTTMSYDWLQHASTVFTLLLRT